MAETVALAPPAGPGGFPAGAVDVVATSLNPASRLAHQIECFRRWQALGATVLSFNHGAERERLLAAGLPAQALVEVADDETMLAFGGRPTPRILPILQRLRAAGVATATLVNSDLFAATNRNPLPLMAAQAVASGYVRNDCSAVAEPLDTPKAPYHGGLDAFCFRADGLADILERLLAVPAAQTMAFGIPGWDLFMGHEVLAMGGRLLEARFLLHPRHTAAYSTIDAFTAQAEPMLASGRYEAGDHVALAAEFVSRIQAQCTRHVKESRLMLRALVDPLPAVDDAAAETDADAQAQVVMGTLLQAQRARPDWRTLYLAHAHLVGQHTQLAVYLMALRSALALMAPQQGERWRTRYPKGSAHGLQLAAYRAEPDRQARHALFLDLLATDLYEHRVLNLNLLKYLRVHCRHEQEERLFASLMDDLRGTRP
uniref:Uncharacterized protein n=1 Tax=Rubrivivax gelatinosus S1 TaxID=1138313 RepID=L8B9W7_RUBGE|nr:hypothetical protein RGS1_70343 [Rubrivivax gelatinosus S1]